MSGFAVEGEMQPQLINNIIVLLHTATNTTPIVFCSLSFFSFFLFQALAV